ncbi:MFS transporter [Beijerinckia sp. L45]|uniref:MFS transporter n=1 Tax=Beijerinckia sp. L45 TaxID=1641855 RepID=UPI001FEF91A6|nr:MFS transporter [Beijerinckia sp. L45]
MPRYALTAMIVACALFMENLDGTVIATSLPAIALDLHEDPIALKLALTSYLLSLAVFIPASGWVADKFGTRTVFRAAIVVFTVGSVLCGLSNSLTGFVLARIFQGIGGAMMVPVGRLLLLRSVERYNLVRAMAYLTLPALLGPMIGPPIGGFITTYFHWRYIFWINVPIGVLGVTLVTLCIQDIREAHVPRLDIPGFFLSAIGLSCLVFGLTILGRGFLPAWETGVLMAFGAAVLGLYVWHAGRVEAPIIDLSLLKIPTFRVSVTGGSLFRIGVGAVPLLLPLMLQLGFGMSPLRSGLITFVAAAGAMAMKATAQPIIGLIGFRRILVFNAVIGAAFIAVNGLLSPATPIALILGILLVGGYFRSLEFTAINAIAYADIDQDNLSRAVSFASVVQQLSLSIGVAIGAGVVQVMRDSHGGGLELSDFHWAFAAVGVVTALSAVSFFRLAKDAGASLSRRTAPAAQAVAEAKPGAA